MSFSVISLATGMPACFDAPAPSNSISTATLNLPQWMTELPDRFRHSVPAAGDSKAATAFAPAGFFAMG
jgi:hypothetical protein